MDAPLILLGMAAMMALMAVRDISRHGGVQSRQKTWLFVAGIFAAMSLILGLI